MDLAVLADDERHDAGAVVLRGPGHERRKTRDVGFEHPEEVAVKRRAGVLARPPFVGGVGHKIAERAALLSVRGRPIKAVLLAGIALELLRELSGRLAVMAVRGVDVLRL